MRAHPSPAAPRARPTVGRRPRPCRCWTEVTGSACCVSWPTRVCAGAAGGSPSPSWSRWRRLRLGHLLFPSPGCHSALPKYPCPRHFVRSQTSFSGEAKAAAGGARGQGAEAFTRATLREEARRGPGHVPAGAVPALSRWPPSPWTVSRTRPALSTWIESFYISSRFPSFPAFER